MIIPETVGPGGAGVWACCWQRCCCRAVVVQRRCVMASIRARWRSVSAERYYAGAGRGVFPRRRFQGGRQGAGRSDPAAEDRFSTAGALRSSRRITVTRPTA